jgi:hypothetical protein
MPDYEWDGKLPEVAVLDEDPDPDPEDWYCEACDRDRPAGTRWARTVSSFGYTFCEYCARSAAAWKVEYGTPPYSRTGWYLCGYAADGEPLTAWCAGETAEGPFGWDSPEAAEAARAELKLVTYL